MEIHAVYDLAIAVGLSHDAAIIATCIAWGESGLNPDAVGDLSLQDSTWGPSIGLWQVRSLKAQSGTGQSRDATRLKDPQFNAQSMYVISNAGTKWTPWTTYKNGMYLSYMDRVQVAVTLAPNPPPPESHTMNLVTRGEWGARAPNATTPIGSAVRGVAIHWEGPHMGWPWPHSECAGKVRSIQAFHMDTRGWNDIAYNCIVCGHGYVFEGRGQGLRSAANGDATVNSTHYAICDLAGEGDDFTPEAQTGINDAAQWLGQADGEWVGHRDLTQTACPGDTIYNWVHNGHPTTTEVDDMATPEVMDLLHHISGIAEHAERMLDGAPQSGELQGGQMLATVLAQLSDLRKEVAAVKAGGGTVDLDALATAVADKLVSHIK
jgi:hypothetical protein